MSNEHVNTTVRSILDTICPPVERQAQPKCSFDMRPIAAAIAQLATMGQPVKPVTGPVVEVSEDQNTVTVQLKAIFEEGPLCSPCIAKNNTELCVKLPCGYGVRKRADGLTGYFREVRG